MTPRAARKLKSLQMSRGDSGDAVVHASAGTGGGRKRAISDPRLEETGSHAMLPTSSGSTIPTPDSYSTAGGSSRVSPSVARAGSTSYFPPGEDMYAGTTRSRASSNASRRQSRIGTGQRDFNLYAAAENARSQQSFDEDDQEDASSDRSGKAGERRDSNVTVTATGGGFFARWRKRSSGGTQQQERPDEATVREGNEAPRTPPLLDEDEAERNKLPTPLTPTDKWTMELEDYRKQVSTHHQAGQQVESIRGSRISPSQQWDTPLHGGNVEDDRKLFLQGVQARRKQQQGSDSGSTYEDPDSPRLQVHDLDEPPLSGKRPWDPPRFISVNRSRKYNGPGQVSPYNANNPFFGYPAYIAPPSGQGEQGRASKRGDRYNLSTSAAAVGTAGGLTTTPRQLHARRRKRDLVRTLTYLFVLRILAAHRNLRWRIKLLWQQIVLLLRGGGTGSWASVPGGQHQQRHQGQVGPHQKGLQHFFLRKRLLVVLVLLAAVVPAWRNALQAWIGRSAVAGAGELASSATKSSARPGAARGATSYTGLHVRRRLGMV